MDYLIHSKHLAPLIPVAANETLFQFSIGLDGSFEKLAEEGTVKVNFDQLPYQYLQVVRKDSKEKWAIGFNVFREGDAIKYQPFFWLGEAPPLEPLESEGKFQVAGPLIFLIRTTCRRRWRSSLSTPGYIVRSSHGDMPSNSQHRLRALPRLRQT